MLLKHLLITTIIIISVFSAVLILYPQPSPRFASATEIEQQTDTTQQAQKPKNRNVKSETRGNSLPEPSDSYYQLIIANNIFLPFGWQPSKKQQNYTLIGTSVSQHASKSEAFILERGSNQMHIVKVGETINDAIIKEIQSKRVILHQAEKDIILYCGRNPFY